MNDEQVAIWAKAALFWLAEDTDGNDSQDSQSDKNSNQHLLQTGLERYLYIFPLRLGNTGEPETHMTMTPTYISFQKHINKQTN
jgi:hypothetical protein